MKKERAESKAAEKPSTVAAPEKPQPSDLPNKILHEITLKPVAESRAFTATIHGQRVAVSYTHRNRADIGHKLNSVTVRTLDDAKKLGKAEGLPVYVAVDVSVDGRWAHGWAIPVDLFYKTHQATADFSFSNKARLLYESDSAVLTGCKFKVAPAAEGK